MFRPMGRRREPLKFEIAGTTIPAEQVPRLLAAARQLLTQQSDPHIGVEYVEALVRKLEEAQRVVEQHV